MWDIIAILVILALLFGIEQMRNIVFGFLGIFAWVIIGIAVLFIIGKIIDLCEDKRTPQEKKNDEAAQKELERRKKKDEEQRAKAVAERHKAWRKAHPKRAGFLDSVSDLLEHHMVFCVVSATIILIGLLIVGVLIFLPK